MHFGDKATSKNAKSIDIRPASVGDPSAASRLDRTNRLLDSFAQDRAEKQQLREEEQARQEEQAKNCEKAKQELARLSNAQYVYSKNAQGEKEILSFEERAAAENELKQKIAKFCGEK